MVAPTNGNGKQDIGLALLGISSSFGIWSALNTSPVGTVQFAINNPAIAYKGMNWGLGIILLMSAGIALYYKKKGYPAAATTGSVRSWNVDMVQPPHKRQHTAAAGRGSVLQRVGCSGRK